MQLLLSREAHVRFLEFINILFLYWCFLSMFVLIFFSYKIFPKWCEEKTHKTHISTHKQAWFCNVAYRKQM